jgi:Domain of unknown function (DUF4386)
MWALGNWRFYHEMCKILGVHNEHLRPAGGSLNMKERSSRIRAIFVGMFILVAYGVLVSLFTQSPVIVMFADVVSGLSVIGIAVLLFPIFMEVSKVTTFVYLLLKGIEGVLMIVAGILYLSVSHQHLRSLIYDKIQVYPFIFGGLLLYYFIYKTNMVPRFIATWGFVAILSLSIKTILGVFGIHHGLLDALIILIISNEIFLAFWLFFKGFSGLESMIDGYSYE